MVAESLSGGMPPTREPLTRQHWWRTIFERLIGLAQQLVVRVERMGLGFKLREVISFMQVVFNLPGTYALEYPHEFMRFIRVFSILNLQQPLVLPYECLGFHSYLARMQLVALLPLLLCTVSFGACAIRHIWTRHRERRRSHEVIEITRLRSRLLKDIALRALPSWLLVVWLLHPLTVSMAFRAFSLDCFSGPGELRVQNQSSSSPTAVNSLGEQAVDSRYLQASSLLDGATRAGLPINATMPPGVPSASPPPPHFPPHPYAEAAEVCYLRADYSTVAYTRSVGASSPTASPEYEQLRSLAQLMIAVYAVLVPSVLLGMLLHERTAIVQRRVARLAKSLTFLHYPYRTECFWYELVEVARKTFVIGFAVFVHQGSILQLVVALVVAIMCLALLLHIRPHQLHIDAYISITTSCSTAFLLLSCIVLRTSRLAEELSRDSAADVDGPQDQRRVWAFVEIDVVHASLGLFASCLLTLAMLGVLTALSIRSVWLKTPYARLKHSGRLVGPPQLARGEGWHVFVSYVWSSGQDQARVVKQMLREVLLGVRVFLDVDDLKEGKGAAFVRRSGALVMFVSRGYFRSTNCMRELSAAVEEDKRLVVVYETEESKGGVVQPEGLQAFDPLAEMSNDFSVSKLLGPESVDPGIDGRIQSTVHNSAGRAVPWYRIRPYLQETMLEIVRQLIEPSDGDGVEIVGPHIGKIRLPARPAAGPPIAAPHVYVSQHNPGVQDIVLDALGRKGCFTRAWCSKESSELRVSTDIALGLRWVHVGLARPRSWHGQQVDSAKLANALSEKRSSGSSELIFSPTELKALDLHNLCIDDFIKLDDGTYWQPCSATRNRRGRGHGMRRVCWPLQRSQRSCFLLYLDRHTWSRAQGETDGQLKARREALTADVIAAMRRGLRFVLVHECGGAESGVRRVHFDSLKELTPQALQTWGVYDSFAIALYDRGWRDVGFDLVARAIADTLRAPAKDDYGEPEGIDEGLLQVDEMGANEEDEAEANTMDEEQDGSLQHFLEEPHLVVGVDDQRHLRVNSALTTHYDGTHSKETASGVVGVVRRRAANSSSWRVLRVPVKAQRDDRGGDNPRIVALRKAAGFLASERGVAVPRKMQLTDEQGASAEGLDKSLLRIGVGSSVLRKSSRQHGFNGLHWAETNAASCSAAGVPAGQELVSAELAAALATKTAFMQTEWDALGVSVPVRPDHFVRVGNAIFRPVAADADTKDLLAVASRGRQAALQQAIERLRTTEADEGLQQFV